MKVAAGPESASVDIEPTELAGLWRGVVDWTAAGERWQPWRLPADRVATAHTEVLTDRAMIPNGARATLRTDASSFELPVAGDTERDSVIDVFVDGERTHRLTVAAEPAVVSASLPAGLKTLQIWLPHSARTTIGALRLTDTTVVEAVEAGTTRWITYGSSITQCNAADGPSETWPALVARANGWDLTALGFGGQCHLDGVVARTIRDRDADVISLCLGINIYGSSSFGPRSLSSAVSGFIETVREGHPSTPIAVMTPIVSPSREETENAVGFTLSAVRSAVADAVRTLQDLGDGNLHLIDGLSTMSADDAELLGDGLHPTGEGYALMAERLAPQLAKLT
jgi:hypothetical protein